MIDWRTLRWMDTASFVDLALLCGFPIDPDVIDRLREHGLRPAVDEQGEPAWSAVHLGVLWLFKQEVVRWHHPWHDRESDALGPVETAGLTAWLAPFDAWIDEGRLDLDWWRQLQTELDRSHPIGKARSLFQLLDESVLDTVRGEARLFLEVDRFFDAFWANVEEQEGDEALAAVDETDPNQPVNEVVADESQQLAQPVAQSDSAATTPVPEPTDTIGLDEEVLRTTDEYDEVETLGETDTYDASAHNGGHQTPGEVAREHARRAAEETSALIPLTSSVDRPSNPEDRVREFEQRERDLFAADAWEDLAIHYRSSLDIFQRDQDVGQLLKKLALVYLEKLDKVEEGTEFLLRALDRLPTDLAGLETADQLLAEQGRWEELAAVWQRTATMSRGDESSEAWTRVALVLLERLDKMPDAVQALRFALEANPYNKSARRALSELAALTPEERSGSSPLETPFREWSRLASIAERWAARLDNATDAADWYERAAELYLSGKESVDKAFVCLEAALERDPHRTSAFSRLESLARHKNRWKAFGQIVERLIDREQKQANVLALSLLSEMLTERKKTVKEAEPIYARLLEIIPQRERSDRSSAESSLGDSQPGDKLEDDTTTETQSHAANSADLAGDVPDDEQTEVDPFFGVASLDLTDSSRSDENGSDST